MGNIGAFYGFWVVAILGIIILCSPDTSAHSTSTSTMTSVTSETTVTDYGQAATEETTENSNDTITTEVSDAVNITTEEVATVGISQSETSTATTSSVSTEGSGETTETAIFSSKGPPDHTSRSATVSEPGFTAGRSGGSTVEKEDIKSTIGFSEWPTAEHSTKAEEESDTPHHTSTAGVVAIAILCVLGVTMVILILAYAIHRYLKYKRATGLLSFRRLYDNEDALL